MEELQQLPWIYGIFFFRKVFLYKKLSPGALSFLGLSRNDETFNSLRTLQFEELTVMRNVLLVIYGGTVSTTFKDDFISFLMLWYEHIASFLYTSDNDASNPIYLHPFIYKFNSTRHCIKVKYDI